MAKHKKTLIIGGGVGPMAGVLLHEHIIRERQGVHRDSDHVDVHHISLVSNMPDRTAYLLGNETINPGAVMAKNVCATGNVLAEQKQHWVVGVPCATFHAPKIYNEFVRGVQNAPYFSASYSLIDAVIDEINLKQNVTGKEKVGILATLGSNAARVWSAPFNDSGIDVLEPSDTTQQKVHDAIYSTQYGLKSCFPASSEATFILRDACQELYEGGATSVVLGCTELPFVKLYLEQEFMGRLTFHDPLQILAKSIVKSIDG
jgi:aspartate racemase